MTRLRRALALPAAALLLGLVLTACGPHAEVGPSPTPSDSATAGATASGAPPIATVPARRPVTRPTDSALAKPGTPSAVFDGNDLVLTLWGSSSCPVIVASARLEGSTLRLTPAPPTSQMCTMDLGPHEQRVGLPAGASPDAIAAVVLEDPAGPDVQVELAR